MESKLKAFPVQYIVKGKQLQTLGYKTTLFPFFKNWIRRIFSRVRVGLVRSGTVVGRIAGIKNGISSNNLI